MNLKLLWIFLIANLFTSQPNKMDLISYKWKIVGYKNFRERYKPAKNPVEEIITYKKDGTYKKILYGKIVIIGKWMFNEDSTKLAFGISEMNAKQELDDAPLTSKYATDTIIKLSNDSLIIGHLGYRGTNKAYGHDDWYYVKAKL